MIKPIPMPSCKIPELVECYKNMCGMNNVLYFYKPDDKDEAISLRNTLLTATGHIRHSAIDKQLKDEIISMYSIVINNINEVIELQYWKDKQTHKGGA